MPLTILRPGPSPSECLEFQVRTRIDRRHEEAVRAETGLGLDDVVQLVRELELGSDPEPAERLLPLLSYFEFEIAYLPFESEPPYLDLATRLQRGARRLALNYGAIGCVDRCVRLLSSGGFALISDLGPTRPERIADLSYAARFGSSVAACVNFPLLEHHLRSLGCEVLEPDGDPDRALHTRLVLPPRSDTDGVSSAESLAAVFARTFGRDGFGDTERRLADATSHINAGRYDAALDAFRDALDRYPRDWNVLGQTAQFLTQQLLRPAEAEELARRALDVHPAHSTFLWNTWGNALFCLGRTAEAHTAYLRANELDPRDAQTQLNLAYTHAQFGRSGDALLAVARGLEADHDGRFEASLLAKQKEIVATLTRQRVEQRERETRRHQAFTALD